MSNLRANLLPILAVVGGAGAALFGLGLHQNPPPAARELKAEQPSPKAAPIPDEQSSPTAKTISGEVLERIDVEKYTYLRLGERGTAGIWTAVPSAEGVQKGSRVSVQSAELMSNFVSATLKRTFDAIYFGVLGTGSTGSPGAMAAAGATQEPAPGPNPHAGPRAVSEATPVPKLPRAAGPLGYTVAELSAKRDELVGKRARVHAVVVKSIGGVLGRTFLHVRDGSGDPDSGNDDLTVTTSASPAVGERVLLEGTVTKDKDFGSGYRYPVLLEDARLVAE